MNRRLRNLIKRGGNKRGARIVNRGVVLGTLILICGGMSTHTQGGEKQRSPSTMPDALMGVWYGNDEGGRQSCNSYKNVRSVRDLGDASNPLMGSLIITEDMMHAYSEYGEGNFYAVKNVVGLGGHGWKVDALVYIDIMPTEGEHAGEDAYHFMLESELLSMTSEMDASAGNRNASRFFRCGDVIDGLYEDQAGTTQ